jgi:hypothetical protein
MSDGGPAGSALDAEALRQRYARERDKRLHPKKNQQWTDIEAGLAHLANDPHADAGFTRAPI